MIKPNKIQEWIEEIEERPMIAPFIVRTLSARLIDLDKQNEALRAENLSLRSGSKTEEYERRIVELEYQIELLKRQVRNEVKTIPKDGYLILFDAFGHLLMQKFKLNDLKIGTWKTSIKDFTAPHSDDIHMLVVDSQDELLFLYDSGRLSTQKALDFPFQEGLELVWQKSPSLELRSGERLVAIVPITRAPVSDMTIQVSRKGLARSIPKDYFQTFISDQNIGKGVRTNADELFNLTICGTQDIYVVVTRSGYLCALPSQKLFITLEEIVKLDMKDYLVAAFVLRPDQHLVFALANGEIYTQRNPWQDAEDADGAKRRLLLTGTKAGGVQVVGASAAVAGNWAFRMTQQGNIYAQRVIPEEDQRKKKTQPANAQNENTIAFSVWGQPIQKAEAG